MHRLAWMVLGSLVLGSTPCVAEEAPGGWEATLANHELSGPDNGPLRIGDLQGDVVVVNFWASWCKPCRKELRVLNDWADDLAGQAASVVAVSIDQDRKHAERFLADAGLTLPLYHDGPNGLARALDLPSLPCTVLLDSQGRVIRVARDGSTEVLQELRNTVRSLLDEGQTARRATEGAAG
ncbi:MAG: hypothetical protein DHS20C21_04360 [Gemmatimonadota bacterium]|nr:MAG: hypothetical protein DHS20C21_04360 [Gemmatimonadota bacterium]